MRGPLFFLPDQTKNSSASRTSPAQNSMAVILKKVWESILTRSSSGSVSGSGSGPDPVPMGPFGQIPSDVLLQIFKFLGPLGAARACAVCRGWREIASDDTLWAFFLRQGKDSWEVIVFSETYLRPGRPHKKYVPYIKPFSELSFLDVYGLRETAPGSIIIDGGSGYCKYGWSKYSWPSGRCATFLEFGNIESPLYPRLVHFFTTIFVRMQVKSSTQPAVVSVPICHSDDTENAKAFRRELREAIHSVLFDLNVPAVCAVDQSVLGLYAARRTSGIIVNIGFNVTSVVPIFHGKVMRKVGVEVIGMGALLLTGFLRDQMQRRNISFESLYTVRTLKEKLCYVAIDYSAELCKNTQASYHVPGEGWFTLSKERFQTGELLFRPQIGGVNAMGLQSAVSLCIHHCFDSGIVGDNDWFKTVVLVGGTSCLPGLPERLEKELIELLPPSISEGIEVLPPPYGVDSAWVGAKIISNVSSFPDAWCITKKNFRKKRRGRFTAGP